MRRCALFIVHWNQPDECIATVNALRAQKIPLQVTIIDNNSETHAFENLKSRVDSEIELVRLNANMGWGGALNVVLKRWLERDENRYCFISAHDAIPEVGMFALID